MFEPKFAGREPSPGALYLTGATVFVDDNDFAGVRLAAANLSKDLEAVTGHASEMSSRAPPRQRTCIVIGSIEKSPTVQRLAQDGQLDVSGIQGRWECYVTSLVRGEHGAKHLVIAGSDKRGAIFGTYSLSEQIGVSPYISVVLACVAPTADKRQLVLVGRCADLFFGACLRTGCGHKRRPAKRQVSRNILERRGACVVWMGAREVRPSVQCPILFEGV